MVKVAKFKPTGEIIAVKILKPEKSTNHILEEAFLLHSLDHPNIVKVKHLIKLNGVFYMGMDYLPGGTLSELIKSR